MHTFYHSVFFLHVQLYAWVGVYAFEGIFAVGVDVSYVEIMKVPGILLY